MAYPNGAETLIVGTSYNILWNSYGTIPKANLYYSIDGGLNYTSTIATAVSNTNTYAWTVPDVIGTQVRVKAANFDDVNNVFDTSNADFTVKGSITLTYPNGSETLIVDEVKNITWNKTGNLGNAKLVYSTDAGATYPELTNTIAASVPADNLTYAWTIPDKIGINLKVKIYSLTYTDVMDESNAVFAIKGSLVITAPDGVKSWLLAEAPSILPGPKPAL